MHHLFSSRAYVASVNHYNKYRVPIFFFIRCYITLEAISKKAELGRPD